MDELKLLTKPERQHAYETVFREAFPAAELKPLSAMERMIADGSYRFYGLLRDGVPVGYVCNWERPGYVLIDYLCVPKSLRCGGLGSAALLAMMRSYPPDTVFIGETEAETGEAERDELILRRQGLYRRLGAQFMPFDCALFGVHYRVMVWAEPVPEPETVLREYDAFYRKAFTKEVYDAAVQIPLRPGEKPHPMKAWLERPNEE